jgi:phospholipase C
VSTAHPAGCLNDLYAWTETTVGGDVNGAAQPANFSTDYAPGKVTTGEGSAALGFYDMRSGDAPYTRYLAEHYAISDNYHQPAMGGTGLNSIMLGFGDALWFSDAQGDPATPPDNEIENPNPQPGTNNWWIQDGFAGGSYSACADRRAPGVTAIIDYLQSLQRPIDPHCEPDHYYLLNNANPGYSGDGHDAYARSATSNTPFTLPPTSQRSIADVLLEQHVSWKYYGEQWHAYAQDGDAAGGAGLDANGDQYCGICNPFQYQARVMANEQVRREHIVDTTDLYADIANGTLPAVSFVKPGDRVDGHPGSSKWNLFEGFAKKIVDAVQANPELWRSTAILITTDEGGGYYDAGYVQPLDFFGDGPRIPLLVVSPYTKPGHVSHEYADHVSILKFIERNWGLPTISRRSRDNLANPVTGPDNAYVPKNTPAIGDLFDLFSF